MPVSWPQCCANCESRTISLHCEYAGCRWVRCGKCGAVTFYWRGRRHHRGGADRWQTGPSPESESTE